MKNTAKQLIEIAICLGIVAVLTGVGTLTGLFDSVSGVFGSLSLNWTVIAQILIMVFVVLATEKLLVLVLNLFAGNGRRSATIVTIARSIVQYAAAITAICWGLSIAGVDVSTIAASVGIVALVIGFGAESLIADVITGLFMMFENQYNVNDIVEVDGFRGTVTSIGIRTTSITDPGGNVKIINNSNMKDILNRSDFSSNAVSEIQISYDTDIEALEQKLPAMMEKIYEKHPDKMKAAPQYLGVSELGDSGVTLKFVVKTDEKDIYSTQRILNRELLVLFKAAQIEIPFPQVDVHTR